MATPKIVADLETQLATSLAIGGTSFTLSSGVDDDGTALPDGKYYFTIDNGTSQKEYVVGTLATGTSVTSVSNVTRQGTESSGVDRAHRVGASVIMTDFLTYKNYIDETTVAGAADADTATKGVLESGTTAEIDADTATGSTGAELAVTPDKLVLSKYGTRLPTADEKTFLTAIEQNTVPPQVVPFTASGTWTKDAGLKYITVEGVGGGGGGGTSTSSTKTGGSGGGYFRKLILASALGATETVTIGAAGLEGATGTNGGATTFGAHCTGNGGTGGNTAVAAGGTATGGDINIQGQASSEAISDGNQSSTSYDGGIGGSSMLGHGGVWGTSPASGYGAGGSGGSTDSRGIGSGTNGTAGIVIVTEYYS